MYPEWLWGAKVFSALLKRHKVCGLACFFEMKRLAACLGDTRRRLSTAGGAGLVALLLALVPSAAAAVTPPTVTQAQAQRVAQRVAPWLVQVPTVAYYADPYSPWTITTGPTSVDQLSRCTRRLVIHPQTAAFGCKVTYGKEVNTVYRNTGYTEGGYQQGCERLEIGVVDYRLRSWNPLTPETVIPPIPNYTYTVPGTSYSSVYPPVTRLGATVPFRSHPGWYLLGERFTQNGVEPC